MSGKSLNLSNNKFSGRLWDDDDVLYFSEDIQELLLSNNMINGPIPAQFKHLTSLTNLALDEAHQDVANQFRAEIKTKWDEEALTTDILLSQKRRLLVRDAMGKGEKQRWNHGEAGDDKVLWYRGEQGYNEWAFEHI